MQKSHFTLNPGELTLAHLKILLHESNKILLNPDCHEKIHANDPATGVMRHADAGYKIALDCAQEHQLKLPMQQNRNR